MNDFEDTKAARTKRYQVKSRGKNRPRDYWERETNEKVVYRRVKINLRELEATDGDD